MWYLSYHNTIVAISGIIPPRHGIPNKTDHAVDAPTFIQPPATWQTDRGRATCYRENEYASRPMSDVSTLASPRLTRAPCWGGSSKPGAGCASLNGNAASIWPSVPRLVSSPTTAPVAPPTDTKYVATFGSERCLELSVPPVHPLLCEICGETMINRRENADKPGASVDNERRSLDAARLNANEQCTSLVRDEKHIFRFRVTVRD